MYTMIILISMYGVSTGGFETIQVNKLDYSVCKAQLVNWKRGEQDDTGKKHGYIIEYADCIPEAETTE